MAGCDFTHLISRCETFLRFSALAFCSENYCFANFATRGRNLFPTAAWRLVGLVPQTNDTALPKDVDTTGSAFFSHCWKDHHTGFKSTYDPASYARRHASTYARRCGCAEEFEYWNAGK